MYDQATHNKLRKLWKLYWKHYEKTIKRYRKAHNVPEDEPFSCSCADGWKTPPFPYILRGLTCGAKTRKGTPCKNKSLYANGRCKFHGGLSTGPKTLEGKRRSAENGKLAGHIKAVEANSMEG